MHKQDLHLIAVNRLISEENEAYNIAKLDRRCFVLCRDVLNHFIIPKKCDACFHKCLGRIFQIKAHSLQRGIRS